MAKRKRRGEASGGPRRLGSGRLLAFLILSASIAVGTALSLTVFFKITEIRVEGQYSVYTEDEIISAAGIVQGDNLLRLPVDEISDRLETDLPYLLGVSVKRELPGTVVITVNDVESRLAIPCSAGYLIISDGMKILEVASELPQGCPLVYGITPETLSPGSVLTTEDENGTEYLEKIVKSSRDASMLTGVSSINVEDRLNLSMVFDNRVFVMIGTASELDYKLQMMSNVLKQEGRDAVGHLDISMPGKAFFSEGSMRVPDEYVTFGPDIYAGMHPESKNSQEPGGTGEGGQADPEGPEDGEKEGADGTKPEDSAQADDKPEGSGQQTAQDGGKPEDSGQQTAQPGDDPEGAGQQTTQTYDKLEGSGQQTAQPDDDPENAGQQSAQPGDDPEDAGRTDGGYDDPELMRRG